MLCSQFCKEAEDYTKENVANHNKAIKKMNTLKKNIHDNAQLKEAVYGILLSNEDTYVRQSAATDCLLMGIHIDAAVQILKNICKYGDRMSAMGAKRALLIWEGKLDPNDPY